MYNSMKVTKQSTYLWNSMSEVGIIQC